MRPSISPPPDQSPLCLETPQDLLAVVGMALGPTGWLRIDQRRVDQFADATGDHQWIHVDPVRAGDGPFGGTIAHGYLTASLANHFLPKLIEVRAMALGINVGADRLRFPAPVRVGQRIRATGEVVKAEEAGGGIQAVIRVTIEIEGGARPACVVDTISRYFPEQRP